MTAGTIRDYIGYGTLAARPASPAITAVTGGSARYFATDTSTEYAWNGSAWVAVSGGGSSTITTADATLSADVTISSTSIVDILTLSLAAGTWEIFAQLSMTSPSGADADLVGALRDGSNTYLSSAQVTQKASWTSCIPLIAKLVLASSGSVKLGATTSAGSGTVRATVLALTAAGAVATQIHAIKVA